MDAYRSEEEQITALKNWWKSNGSSLLLGIGLALLVVFGWKAYQKHALQTAEAASNKYQNLLLELVGASKAKDASLDNAKVYIHDLKEEYPDSSYALYAALIMSKLSMDAGNAQEATEELRWVLDKKPDAATERLVKSRLARILATQEKYDDAVALLDVAKDDAFYSYFMEVKGDILIQAGKRDEAREAYQSALDQVKSDGRNLPILEIKLADLAKE